MDSVPAGTGFFKGAAFVKKAFQILWKVIWRFAVACLLMLAVLVGVFISNMLYNHIALYRFSRQLFHHPLPAETTVIEKASACGRFEDTGNGMEFIAVILVESALSKEELEAFYNRTAYRYARGDAFPGGEYGPSGPISVRVESAARAQPESYWSGAIPPFQSLEGYASHENLYFISLYDGIYFAWLDPRGG